ncbi:MAG: hypothetical protein AVDCRST_MAG96-740 [uncultured Segetibacter sp.]|uniref:Uncharacterized protein n=1 Tax=uncultured Segetibacter sp. TaxID=481133 RepID=A0A6J4RPZ9_9BACT|nr:MAG: hypothetical protein AVDCRST_MAG96-740 [uncultured Segetibacter sp.]
MFRFCKQLRQRQSWYFDSIKACTSTFSRIQLQSQLQMSPTLQLNN